MEPERPSTVAFDRAVAYYDRTRGLTNAAMDRIGAILQSELRGRRCLEAGIGTGRIGVPLLERGVDLVGLDLSLPMLLKLRDKRRKSPIVQGDVTRLPFGDRTFDRVLAVHVLHLIPNWQAMLDEVVRVLAPGGALVINDTEGFGDLWADITQRFSDALGIKAQYLGVIDLDEIGNYLARKGAGSRSLQATEERRRLSPEEIISRLEDGQYSFTWRSPPETRVRAGRTVREWAANRYGSLTDPVENHYVIGWRVFDLP